MIFATGTEGMWVIAILVMALIGLAPMMFERKDEDC
jgi:hypothetical protein